MRHPHLGRAFELVEAENYALVLLQDEKKVADIVVDAVFTHGLFPPAENGVLADDAFNFTRDLHQQIDPWWRGDGPRRLSVVGGLVSMHPAGVVEASALVVSVEGDSWLSSSPNKALARSLWRTAGRVLSCWPSRTFYMMAVTRFRNSASLMR